MAKNTGQKDSNTSKRFSIDGLKEMLKFEELLADLAAVFVNLPHERVDTEIERGLALVGEFLGADRGGISQFSEDRTTISLTHGYVRPGIPPHPKNTFEIDKTFYWYKKTLLTRGLVVFENLPEDLPEEADSEKQFCIEHGVKSNIAFPLWTGSDQPDGVIGFAFIRNKQAWQNQCIQRVQFIGQLFAGIGGIPDQNQSLD